MLKIIIDSHSGIGKVETIGTIQDICADYLVIDSIKLQVYDNILEQTKKGISKEFGIKLEEVDEKALEKTVNAVFEGVEVAVSKVGGIYDDA